MRKRVECSTVFCKNKFLFTYKDREELNNYNFCKECRKNNSRKALVIQIEFGKPIKEILIDSSDLFDSVDKISDYLGVSFVTVYNWIEKYFGMSFQDFKKTYICKSTSCHIVDIKRISYSRTDYILKKLHDRGYCTCVSALKEGHIMTNAPIQTIESILRGSPKIEKISDKVFRIGPNPIKTLDGIIPVSNLEKD